MFCTKCKNRIEECECGDIEERLEQLDNHANFATDRCKGCRKHPEDCTCDEYDPHGAEGG